MEIFKFFLFLFMCSIVGFVLVVILHGFGITFLMKWLYRDIDPEQPSLKSAFWSLMLILELTGIWLMAHWWYYAWPIMFAALVTFIAVVLIKGRWQSYKLLKGKVETENSSL